MVTVSGHNRQAAIVLCGLLLVQLAFWFWARPMQARWINVPPVPSLTTASFSTLGDKQLAYRMYAMHLQNMGDEAARTVPLKDYNYDRLGDWLNLLDNMDAESNFMPLLAAYYYGATQDPRQLTPIIEYLAQVGRRGVSQKWRWLAQAVYLARHRQGDRQKALYLADQLANLPVNMPYWARQMKLIVTSDMGDKAAAKAMILNILRTEGENLPIHEVNFLLDMFCNRLMNEYERGADPICQKVDL